MIFGGLANLTLLDYPGKVACTVFTKGCNFRCPFCHNATLVDNYDCQDITEEQVLAFLQKRKAVLEGICISGGEPTLHKDLYDFVVKVKNLGYSVKLDTNGTNPQLLTKLIENKLVDYVAMDVKNSPSLYDKTAGCKVDMTAVDQSVQLLKSGVVDYEFRTTVTGNLHDTSSIEQLGKYLQGSKKWFLQMFVDSGNLIDSSTSGCSEQTMKDYLAIATKYVPNAQLRGVN